MKVLVVDIGGSNVKLLALGRDKESFASGPKLTPTRMVSKVRSLVAHWEYDVVSIGYPGAVSRDRAVAEPWNLGTGWVGFNFEAGFKCPVKVINDAALQALGSYAGGKMLFLGFGTGLGSALIIDGTVAPLELGHLPYKNSTFEDYVGVRALQKYGKQKWRRYVSDIVKLPHICVSTRGRSPGGRECPQIEEAAPSLPGGRQRKRSAGWAAPLGAGKGFPLTVAPANR